MSGLGLGCNYTVWSYRALPYITGFVFEVQGLYYRAQGLWGSGLIGFNRITLCELRRVPSLV